MGYDVIIVGAGSAGGVLANRLSADPDRSVLLLEAGPDFGSAAEDQPEEIVDINNLTETPYDWGYTSEPAHIPLFAGRVVGGSSATNNAMALRGQPADYDGWAALGNPGLVSPTCCRTSAWWNEIWTSPTSGTAATDRYRSAVPPG